MRMRLLLCPLLLLALLTGCIRQRPVLVGEPTPQPTPVPTPPPLLQSLPVAAADTDALGAQILDGGHYLRYLKFTNLRVYEYEGGTLFDGICTNAYPQPLYGPLELTFSDKDGIVVARADVHARDGSDCYTPGETVLYAQIDTDMDIQMLPFTLLPTETVGPELTAPPAVAQSPNP